MKTYIEPENGPLEEKIPNLETLIFRVKMRGIWCVFYIETERLKSFRNHLK